MSLVMNAHLAFSSRSVKLFLCNRTENFVFSVKRDAVGLILPSYDY